MLLLLALSSSVFAKSSSSSVVEKLMKQKGSSDGAKLANLAKFLTPGSETASEADRVNFQKLLLEAKGMSPERAESIAALKSLKEVETKVKLQKFMKRTFRNMLQRLFLKMKARVDARNAFVREHQMSSNVRVAAEIRKRWGATPAKSKGRAKSSRV